MSWRTGQCLDLMLGTRVVVMVISISTSAHSWASASVVDISPACKDLIWGSTGGPALRATGVIRVRWPLVIYKNNLPADLNINIHKWYLHLLLTFVHAWFFHVLHRFLHTFIRSSSKYWVCRWPVSQVNHQKVAALWNVSALENQSAEHEILFTDSWCGRSPTSLKYISGFQLQYSIYQYTRRFLNRSFKYSMLFVRFRNNI